MFASHCSIIWLSSKATTFFTPFHDSILFSPLPSPFPSHISAGFKKCCVSEWEVKKGGEKAGEKRGEAWEQGIRQTKIWRQKGKRDGREAALKPQLSR